MGYTADDAASDAYYSAQQDADLEATGREAESIVAAFLEKWGDQNLRPGLEYKLELGGEDQPLFVFSLLIDLDEDFDADDWPADDIETMTSDLRSRIAGTPVDNWDWLVTTAVKASRETA